MQSTYGPFRQRYLTPFLTDLMLRFAVSENGRIHSEKYYRTVTEEFAATHEASIWDVYYRAIGPERGPREGPPRAGRPFVRFRSLRSLQRTNGRPRRIVLRIEISVTHVSERPLPMCPVVTLTAPDDRCARPACLF